MEHHTFTWFFRQKRRKLTLKFWLKPLRFVLEWMAIPVMRLFGCYCFMLEEGPFPTSYWPKGMTRPANGTELYFGYNRQSWASHVVEGGKINPAHQLHNESIIPIREDFNPDTGEPLGILIEEARTNLLRSTHKL